MRKLSILFAATLLAVGAGAQNESGNLVLVEGGLFRNQNSIYHAKGMHVADFYIGKYEVTQKEWADVMGSNPSTFIGDSLPVETVSWYDCIEYCNKRSLKEGLKPCYTIDRENKDPANQNAIDDVKWTVTLDPSANGYRLPTEAEWEYAAGGGRLSKGYVFSGSNDIDQVGWYFRNSGDAVLHGLWNWPMLEQNKNRTRPVGGKPPNELGLHDMSGNVREWCWEWFREREENGLLAKESPAGGVRLWKGGGWIGGDFCGEPSFRAGYEASGRGPDQGFRVCRSKPADDSK